MENQTTTFSTHATDLRARSCRVIAQLGVSLNCLEQAEEMIAHDNHGEPFADLALLDHHLEEMASALDTADEHLRSVYDKLDLIRRAARRALLAAQGRTEVTADSLAVDEVSYRVRGTEGGAT